MQLDKVGGRSVQNANEIRSDIRTRALVSRGSMDIYADILFMVEIQCHFPQFADGLGIFVQA